MIKQFTKEEAITFWNSGVWKDWTDNQIVALQLYQQKMCVPWGRFHEATEKVLERPVWTHEFAHPERLQQELEQNIPAPTMEKILSWLPAEQTILVVTQNAP